MKTIGIKELVVKNTFNNGNVDSTYIITYVDTTYQIFDVDDLSEYDKHRIGEFIKIAQIDLKIKKYPKNNITKTVGIYYI